MMFSKLTFSFLILASSLAYSFPYDDSLDDLESGIVLQGIDSRTEGTVVTYNIPTSDWPDLITLNVRGGDGGRAKATADIGSDKSANGGGGAYVSADFLVGLDGSNPNYLKPGGQLRFIVGNKGEDRTRTEASAGGGGGGSAVLYLAPENGAAWEILVVAGGGGGGAAGTSVTDTFSQSGADASTTVDGTDGKGQGTTGREGGINGDAGVSVDGGLGGGGGSYRANSTSSDGTFWVSSGESGGNLGAAGGEAAERGAWGGFGFGSGGGGYVNSGSNAYTARGGGGGGYSGGGAGGNNSEGDGAGGGGGTYVNPISSGFSITSRDSGELNGEITVRTFKISSDDGIPGPSISLNGSSNISIDRDQGETYTEFGATATDYYGNSITVIDPGFSSSTPGAYNLPYIATDQFGKLALATRTVTILGAKPTFAIAGNFTVAEDSGLFTVNEYAYDFNANDTGQSLISYEVTNTNNALFSAQPAITNQGTLSFTPAPDANGTATVSVVAIDDISDTTRGRSDALSFTITVNGVNDPPIIYSSSTHTFTENSSSSATVILATEPFGADMSYSISGGDDASLFEFTGAALGFKVSPDFELPADADQDNLYEVEVTVTGSDGSATLDLEITVQDVNEAPATVSISEDQILENNTLVGRLSATDPEGDSLTYSIVGGNDAAFFEIIGSNLAFINAPDYESPLDSNTNNYYRVDIVANDGELSSEETIIIVLVTNDTAGPVQVTISNTDVPENWTSVGTVTGYDVTGGAMTYQLESAQGDGHLFTIDSETGVLDFISAPNYEAPQDADQDNQYVISVKVFSQEGSTVVPIYIWVHNVADGSEVDFRMIYGLASDGADDFADWSGNGVPNLHYYLFGLGDPNDASIDRSLLPTITPVEEGISFSYRYNALSEGATVTPMTSTDLDEWVALSSLEGTAEQALEVISVEEEEGITRVTTTFPITSGARFFTVETATE